MSGMRHATISAWKREEDGSYAAELHGFTLHVHWHPESSGRRRGFTWEARPAAGSRLTSDEVFEEIEVAMAHAEERVEPRKDPAKDADAGHAASHH